ncbi:MAG: glycosyltransferase family 4 protein [Ktedonobacteraceae bacterium]
MNKSSYDTKPKENMRHIVFITPYYPPEKAAAAVCVSENAVRLVRRGHQVTVLTTVPNYPNGVVPAEYRGRILQDEMLDGVHVIRVWSFVSPNKGFLRRILAQFSFGLLAPLLGWREIGQPDIIIVQSPPLFDAIAVRLLAWFKRCPFIYMVSDLWPESAVEMGVLRNRLLIRLSEWLEWSTYQRASLVWVVTEGIKHTLLKRGFPPERLLLLTNGVDTVKFHPSSQIEARRELDWDDRFTVVYVGTHGLSHGLATVLDTAEFLKNHPDILFVLVGDGAEKENLVIQANKRALTNITFYDAQPHKSVPIFLAAADACLVHVRRNIPVFTGMLPIKMYEAMACGKPVLLGVDGEARRLAEQEAGAALYVEPENPMALASAILSLQQQPALAQVMGQRGRALVEEKFDYNQLVLALDARIDSLLKEPACKPQEKATAHH